jgi:membrane-associated protease RseP (regulator of RpoE activity)
MTPQDQMAEGEEGRAFFAASSAKKLIVLGAGSFAHFLLGFLLIFSIFFGVGYQALLPDITKVSPQSAAAAAGFQEGDRLLTIDGDEVDNWAIDSKKIAESKGREIVFTVKRGNEILTLKANPQYIEEEKRYLLGVVTKVGVKRDGVIQSTQNASSATWALARESVKSLFTLPTKVPELFRQTFMGEERDPNGLVGVVGAARVSGEVVGSENLAGNQRLQTFILIVASLNIFVGLFNLLPLLPLDGGHMAVAIADEFRALIARIRKKPRPAGIDVNVLTPITMAVFVVLAVLTVVLLVADIINPISLGF